MSLIPDPVVASVLTDIFRDTLGGLKNISKVLGQTIQDKDVFGFMAKKYRHYAHQRHGHITIFGINPVPLPKIYTRVNVYRRLGFRKHIEGSAIQPDEIISAHGYSRDDETVLGMDIINTTQYVMLLGAPGSGKSTFMKHLLLQAIDGRLQNKLIPVYISFNDISKSSVSILDAISNEFEHAGISEPRGYVEDLLLTGKCLLLLDGLDEIPSDRRAEIIREIIVLSARYSSCRWIVSSRIAAYNFWFEQFTNVEIANFGEAERKSFVENWFHDKTQDAVHLLELFAKQKTLRELACTPLLLAMICISHENSLNISTNRAELYKDAVDVLLRRWDGNRHINREEIYRGLNLKRKMDLISRIAVETFGMRLYYFSAAQVSGIVRDLFAEIENADNDTIYADPSSVLDAIDIQHGIITRRAHGLYTFSHFTFHEYFCALYLSSMDLEVQKNVVHMYAHDVSWREVLILLSSFSSNADGIVLAMAARVTDFTGSLKALSEIRDAQLKIAEEKMPEFLKRLSSGGRSRGTPYLTAVFNQKEEKENINSILAGIRTRQGTGIPESKITSRHLHIFMCQEIQNVLISLGISEDAREEVATLDILAWDIIKRAAENARIVRDIFLGLHEGLHVHVVRSRWAVIENSLNNADQLVRSRWAMIKDAMNNADIGSEFTPNPEDPMAFSRRTENVLFALLGSWKIIVHQIGLRIDKICDEYDQKLEKDPFFATADLLGAVLVSETNITRKTREIATSALLSAFEDTPPGKAA